MAQPDDIEDHEMVAQTLAGRRDAFAALVERYQRPVLSIAYRLTGNRGTAQELAQEAFLRAYQSLSGFGPARPIIRGLATPGQVRLYADGAQVAATTTSVEGTFALSPTVALVPTR